MKKNLKYIIAISVPIIIIIITVLLYYSRNTTQNRLPPNNRQQQQQDISNLGMIDIDINNQANTITQQDNQIYQAAANAGNADKCSKMSDDAQKDLCVKLLAIKSKDNQLCDKIINKDLIQECQDRVNFEIATQNKDLELCKTISEANLNSSCVINIISQNQYNEQDCEKLEDSNQKNLCLGHVLYEEATTKNDISLCQKIPGEGNNSECLNSIINEHDNLDYCQSLPDELQETCVQIIARKLAFEKKDKSLCDKISDSGIQNECKESVDGILDQDNDGLTNAQEKIYKTDPNNPDTDKDGYSDGDEVKDGFNPLGEGKML